MKDDAGKFPVWNETYDIEIPKELVGKKVMVKFEVMDEETLKDRLIVEGSVTLDSMFKTGDHEQDLHYNKKAGGKLFLSFIWTPSTA